MENKLFRRMMSVSRQIGAENAANMEIIPNIKMDFECSLPSDIKEELAALNFDYIDLTENERSALIFSFIQGWNSEVFSRMGI